MHALLAWVSVGQLYQCMSALAAAGGADIPSSHGSSTE